MPRKGALAAVLKLAAASASMRPGLLCPGRAWPCVATWALRTRFNEAGAVMPRKGEAYAADELEAITLQ